MSEDSLTKEIQDKGLVSASQEFFTDEAKYSLKANLLDLCGRHGVTPQSLCDFIEETSIEHEQTGATESDSYPADYLDLGESLGETGETNMTLHDVKSDDILPNSMSPSISPYPEEDSLEHEEDPGDMLERHQEKEQQRQEREEAVEEEQKRAEGEVGYEEYLERLTKDQTEIDAEVEKHFRKIYDNIIYSTNRGGDKGGNARAIREINDPIWATRTRESIRRIVEEEKLQIEEEKRHPPGWEKPPSIIRENMADLFGPDKSVSQQEQLETNQEFLKATNKALAKLPRTASTKEKLRATGIPVTNETTKDFELLVSLGVFNSGLMNDAVPVEKVLGKEHSNAESAGEYFKAIKNKLLSDKGRTPTDLNKSQGIKDFPLTVGLSSVLKSKGFWITIVVLYLIWLGYHLGTIDNRELTPQEVQDSVSICKKWGGEVLYDANGQYYNCAINGRVE